MKITYDKEIDALNVVLRRGVVAKTIEVADEILLDIDKKGQPLYLEILSASTKIGRKNFGKVTLGKKTFKIPAFA